MKNVILLFFLINSVALKAQHDSTYFIKYSHKLALGFFSTLRNYNLRINSNMSKDAGLPDIDFATNGRLQWGLAFGYDKIRLGIAIGKSANNDIYGQSRTQNLAADIGGNAIFIAVGYRKYTGMYDKNSTGYMPANGPTYYIDPSLQVTTFRLKGMYFFNHKKYAFGAAYMANQRQIKSAASWLVTSNLHHEKINTAATIIPHPLGSYYGGDAQLQTLQWWGLNMGAGATGNLVIFRKLFIHGTISFGTETQFREYVYNTGYNKKVTAMGLAGDFKAGIGFNSESFFISINNNIDYHSVSLSNLKIVESLVTGYLIIGYRFKVKDPPLYKKVRETKLYKSL